MRQLSTHSLIYRLIPVSFILFLVFVFCGCSSIEYTADELDKTINELIVAYNNSLKETVCPSSDFSAVNRSFVRASVQGEPKRVVVQIFENSKEKEHMISEWVSNPDMLVFENYPELTLIGEVMEMTLLEEPAWADPPEDISAYRQHVIVKPSAGNFINEVHEYVALNIENYMIPIGISTGKTVKLWVSDDSSGTSYKGSDATLIRCLKIELVE